MSEDPERNVPEMQAGLKALVTRLDEAQLLLVRAWVETEIRMAKKPALRIVRPPSRDQPDEERWVGSFVELAGAVRHRIHELPVDRLVVLYGWVLGRLDEQYPPRR